MRTKARAKRQYGLSGFIRRDFLRRQTRGVHGLFRNDKAHKSQVLLHFRGGFSLIRENRGFDALVIWTTNWRNPRQAHISSPKDLRIADSYHE